MTPHKAMKDEIFSHLNEPRQLERLYRTDKAVFKRTFNSLYPEIKDNNLVAYWNERLNYSEEEISWGNRKDLIFIIIASLLAGLIAKFPEFLSIDEDFFYTRNIGFIVFPLLTINYLLCMEEQIIKN